MPTDAWRERGILPVGGDAGSSRRMDYRWFAPLLLLVACGGGSSILTDGGAGDGGSSGGPGGAGDGGSDAAAPHCTPGDAVFCRCSNRDEGTKACAADGQSFEACKTATGPCPP